ncbi:hypothetical protein ACP70R_039373 [Stipagrostis hirtigluma subsp. patula]
MLLPASPGIIWCSSSPEKDLRKGSDLYVYRADGGGDGGPSLHLLPRPHGDSMFVDSHQVGLLRYRNDHGAAGVGGNKKDDEDVVAAIFNVCHPAVASHLPEEAFEPGPERFALYVYDSKLHAWSIKLVSLDQHQQLQQPEGCFLHFNSKVIPIGGEAGTMGFVDLWRGILLWDALTGNPKLHYATLPPPILPGWEGRGDARLSRDIAVSRYLRSR